ncbi:hypothetical protein BDA96_04G025600 [Sorghum bicolor]|uniref:Uncharacterized protein n=1 Tax=Sorghum bicolor TaxID=4558 RepID=A0A921R199_SORBI|nr:hypothetical protein BDA96_04G025600 [Sorghum bicolor]
MLKVRTGAVDRSPPTWTRPCCRRAAMARHVHIFVNLDAADHHRRRPARLACRMTFAILVMGPKFHWSNQEELVMAASQETLMSRCPNNRIGEPLTKQAVASLWVAHPCMGGLLHLHAPHPPTHPKDATAPHGRCMGGLPRRHGSLPSAPYFHGKGPHATTSQ